VTIYSYTDENDKEIPKYFPDSLILISDISENRMRNLEYF
jgi:hypothetical protein